MNRNIKYIHTSGEDELSFSSAVAVSFHVQPQRKSSWVQRAIQLRVVEWLKESNLRNESFRKWREAADVAIRKQN